MTVSWRCTFLLRFLPLEILRFQCRKNRLNLPSPLCPLSPNPFSQLNKKIIKEYITECEEPYFLLSLFTSVDLMRFWPWTSQAGRSCCSGCSGFSLLPTTLHLLSPLWIWTLWFGAPWVSYSHQLVEKGLKIWGVSQWRITLVWWGAGRKLWYWFYAILFILKKTKV